MKITRHRVKRNKEEKRDGLDLAVCVDRDAGKKIRRASECLMGAARCCVVDSIGRRAYPWPRGLDADIV